MKTYRTILKYSLLTIPVGLVINVTLAQLALVLELPLFVDCVGTVLAAALGGYLPGIVVGFITNLINSIADPVTLYYGILNTMIALAATWLAKRGVFKSLWKTLLSALLFAVIGGGGGSVITWFLYGFNFGAGISAPYAIMLNDNTSMGTFWSQFAADMLIDVVDKLITVVIVFAVIKLIPKKLMGRLPMSAGYSDADRRKKRGGKRFYRKHSLRIEVVALIITTSLILGTLATMISAAIYTESSQSKYEKMATGAVNLAMDCIDADMVEQYLATLEKDDAYNVTLSRLTEIRESFSDIEYVYVYQIREEGCYVVYDVDTEDLAAGQLGELVNHDEAFSPYLADLLAGREIESVVSDETYGWLLTVYKPLYASDGHCVAYVAADVQMSDILYDRYTFIIKIVSLLFGASIIIITIAVWFAEYRLVLPINSMTVAADRFAYYSEAERIAQQKALSEIVIDTGDEIESLSRSLTKTASDMVRYIGSINEKAEIISQMQCNIILSFADMVENRDLNTGKHIKHTAAYVGIIAEKMKELGMYPRIIDDDYIKSIVRSAPLHDIGKIKIPDALLNKPGKLTPEEFELMKTHTTSGREILRKSMSNLGEDYLASAADMAAYHHEWWNGKGYPEGLVGEQIPLSARIMAVADVFDALVSKRSYKEAFGFEEALAIIKEESDSHFDPQVVKALIESKDEIKKVLDDRM